MKIIPDATCTACSCTCDDITLHVEGAAQIVEAERACPRGDAWFREVRPTDRPVCTIEGRPATLEAGIERAAQILVEARRPLVYGLAETTCETQRKAVGLADWIGAVVDTPTSADLGPIGVTFQGVGEVTCTLGEICNRGDLIIFWGANPAETHPRHFEKFSLFPVGEFLPNGRADRYAIVIDVRPTATSALADQFIAIKPGGDFEACWILRALAKGIALDAAEVEAQTGVPLRTWEELIARMKQARFGVFLYGAGLMQTRGGHLNVEALLALTRDLNAYTRFVGRALSGGGNLVGADNVLTWRTGYPFGVDLTRGYPRFNPGEYAAGAMSRHGEVDAALVVVADPMSEFSDAARRRLASIPTIAVDFCETPTTQAATVAFRTAPMGISTPGTVYRHDDVSLPLRPAITSPYPSDLDVLTRLEERIRG